MLYVLVEEMATITKLYWPEKMPRVEIEEYHMIVSNGQLRSRSRCRMEEEMRCLMW